MYPPEVERDGNCCYTYLKSEEFTKPADMFAYSRKIRRVSRIPTIKNEDAAIGTEFSWYDVHFHQPWDNEYHILGEDTFKGHDCFVVEAKSRIYPDFYLSKWFIWVEKNNFIDLHEEQFDKQERVYKVIDKRWDQLTPSNHWVYSTLDVVNPANEARTIWYFFNWKIDSGYKEQDFDAIRMSEEKIWKKCKPAPPAINKLSDLPPAPKVRQEFWNNPEIK